MRRKHDIENILEKGHEIIRQKGYNKTGVEEIIKACKIPKGSFYNFFESKEDFGIKALNYYTEKQYQFIKGYLTNKKIKPINRLKKLYKSMTDINKEENFAYGCLIGNMTQEMAGISDGIIDEANKDLKKIRDLVKDCIEEAQRSGEIRNDFSANDLSVYVQNNFYGAQLKAKAEKDINSYKVFMKMTFDFLTAK
ncbi:MAG: TetR family transcriptional regulator C-terminal domain-containing protein [Bacteroidetes bacterium]|nr:TetR family transcriptional regulator C-terminal domain-containing protein [Bacteroidota bacterium]